MRDKCLIDTHCHMDLTNDVDTIIMEADNNNVKRMIISGCDKKSIRDGLEIIYRYDEIFMTAGFHPDEADIVTDKDLEDLENVIKTNKKNIGVALSRNLAYPKCTGEYVTQLDSDDYYFTDVFNSIVDNDLTADIVYFDLQVNSGAIWRSSPQTRYTLMDHVYLVKRDLLGEHRHPDLPYGSGVELNNAIQNDLDKRKGSVIYTKKVAYKYNFPRDGSILNLKNRGLI